MKIFVSMLFCLQLLWSGSALSQTFNATVNRTDIPQGETFLLTLSTDDVKNNASPDLSVLDTNFNIYSVGNAFSSSYVNGVSTHSRQWQIVLMPKNAGQIEIPAIKLGNLTSEPITLNVSSVQLKNTQNPSQQNISDEPKFAVDAKVDNKNPFVQQQINYTFSIYDSGGLFGEAPIFIDNGSNDWIIKGLGEPIINTKVINGRQLREIQFKYALFPQKSGILKTPDIEFRGYYLTKTNQRHNAFDDVFNSGFFNIGFSDMFASRNPVVLTPESIDIDVKAIPSINTGYWWLPASQVVLSSEWDTPNPTFKVGEAITRSVYLKAYGVIENQLPDINFAKIDGIKQYPEKPVAMSSQNNGEIVSIKKFSNVFIPEKSGQIKIPAVSINWYNIQTGQLEKAELPAQTINVLPANIPNTNTFNPYSEQKSDTPSQPQTTTEPTTSNAAIFAMIIMAFFIGLIFSYLIFAKSESKIDNARAKDFARKIEQDIATNNLKSLRDNLLAWARLNYNDTKINNIDDFIQYCSGEDFKTHLGLLGQALYSNKKNKFNPDEFLKCFKQEQKNNKQKKTSTSPLPELYKK